MAGLNESLNVTITSESKTVSSENFGMMLIAGPNVNGTARTVAVSSNAEAAAALNGGVNAPEYIKVRDAFSQQNAPALVKLGKVATTGITTITDNAGPFTQGSISTVWALNGVAQAAVTTAWGTSKSSTLTAHAAALQVAIRAAIGTDTTSTVGYTDGSHIIVITPETPTTNIVTVTSITLTGLATTDTLAISTVVGTASEAYDVGLAAIQLFDDDWYQIQIASSAKADVVLGASFVTSSQSPKFFSTESSDTVITNTAVASDTTSIAYQLKHGGYSRTAGFFSGTAGTDSVAATQSLASATMALISAFKPGYYNVAYKTPQGITPDLLNTSQELISRGMYLNGIFTVGKDFNTFETLANVNIVRWGRTTDGNWIDQVIFQDAISADLQTAVYSMFANSQKIPRDINGYAKIEGAIESVLRSYQKADASGTYGITPYSKDDNGNQDGGYVITMPAVSDASSADKTGRVLNGVVVDLWYATPMNSVKMSLMIAL